MRPFRVSLSFKDLPTPDISTSSEIIEFRWICETHQGRRKEGREEGGRRLLCIFCHGLCQSPGCDPIPPLPKKNWLINTAADYITQVIGYARAGSRDRWSIQTARNDLRILRNDGEFWSSSREYVNQYTSTLTMTWLLVASPRSSQYCLCSTQGSWWVNLAALKAEHHLHRLGFICNSVSVGNLLELVDHANWEPWMSPYMHNRILNISHQAEFRMIHQLLRVLSILL